MRGIHEAHFEGHMEFPHAQGEPEGEQHDIENGGKEIRRIIA